MNKCLAGHLAVAFVIVALDRRWLGRIAKAMYQPAIRHLMAGQPSFLAAWA